MHVYNMYVSHSFGFVYLPTCHLTLDGKLEHEGHGKITPLVDLKEHIEETLT